MTKRDTAVKISTPCTRKCKLINDHCVGCGRSWQQIRDWFSYKENPKFKNDSIIRNLNFRIKKSFRFSRNAQEN